MESGSKRSGSGVCFPSGWWWAAAASINTCLHGSHISCLTPHPSSGPHRLRTPQQAHCTICLCMCTVYSLQYACSPLLRSTWSQNVCMVCCYHRKSLTGTNICEKHEHTHTSLKTSRLYIKEDIFHFMIEGRKDHGKFHLIQTYVVNRH